LSRRNLAAFLIIILLVFGISAVAQTGQTDRQALQQICGILVNQGVATGCVTTSTTLPPTTSPTTSTTQPPTTSSSTSTTLPPTTTTAPATGQPTCTGAGLSNPGALVVSTGTVTITTNGAVVENREIRGRLLINANNVTVRNVWVWSSGTSTIQTSSSGAVFDHVEVGKQGTPNERGIAAYGSGITIRNSYIHDVEDGIKMGSGGTYTGNRIQLLDSPASSPHSDAIQADGGQSNVVITGNCLDSRTFGGGLGNAALQIDTSLGGISNFRIEGNALNGGNYTVFWRNGGNGNPTNGQLLNNWFGCQSRYGTVSSDGNLTRSGNRWAAGCPNAGQLIPGG
jgi:hypothetical protein